MKNLLWALLLTGCASEADLAMGRQFWQSMVIGTARIERENEVIERQRGDNIIHFDRVPDAQPCTPHYGGFGEYIGCW